MERTERRTLIVTTPHFGRGTGGLGVSSERITRGLLFGFDVEVIVPTAALPPLALERTEEPGLTMLRIGLGKGESFLCDFHDLIGSRIAATDAAAVLSFYATELCYAAGLAARKRAVPHAVLLRGDDADLEPFGVHGWMTLESVRTATLVGVVTRSMLSFVRALGAEKRARYLPNAVDPVIFSPADPARLFSGPPRVGIFGALKRKKGLAVLLEHLGRSSTELLISGALRDDVARELHGFMTLVPEAAARIELVPMTTSERELVERYHAVDVVALPSLREGMSNVMLEAMSCERVVVASAVGGALDVIEDGATGFLFSPADPDSFDRAVERAVAAARDPERAVGRAARHAVNEHLSHRRERERYHELVGELLANVA